MRTISLRPLNFLLLIFDAWGVFLISSTGNYDIFQLQNIICFLFLILAPGVLTLYALRLRDLPVWGYISLVIAFSLLELMLAGLLGNTILPLFGVLAPLSKSFVVIEVTILVALLSLVPLVRMEDAVIPIPRYPRARDIVLSFSPVLLTFMSVLGTVRLNDGASGIVTLVMLGGIGAYLLYLLRYAEEVGGDTIPTGIFFIALALLLMTSLRGWYITGHDIQLEYKVFELTKNAGLWSMAAYRDAYNACLSITILPTVFSAVLNVYDQYIYKFYFQIFFALCPGLVYLISNRWTGRRISLLSAIYFLALPTFSSDMPFLVRQEVAFLFFGLMIYVLFEPAFSIRLRRLLFMMMGAGVIISHYSTTYTVLLILGITVASRPLVALTLRYLQGRGFLRECALDATVRYITGGMVLALVLLSFVWTSRRRSRSSGSSSRRRSRSSRRSDCCICSSGDHSCERSISNSIFSRRSLSSSSLATRYFPYSRLSMASSARCSRRCSCSRRSWSSAVSRWDERSLHARK